MDIPNLWATFNPWTALAVFIVYLFVDGAYAYYTLEVTKRNPYSAATTGALMHFLLAFGVLSYTENLLYVLPLAIGSWIGTFIIVKREKGLKLKDLNMLK